MDMITLAMAKAYTDEKVANSGGSSSGGAGLPVVETSVEFSMEEAVELTAEESEKLDAAASMGLPCIIKFVYFGQETTAVFSMIVDDGTPTYMYVFGTLALTFTKQSDIWDAVAILSE